jgi:hypothetical protein
MPRLERPPSGQLSDRDARWLALGAQGLTAPRLTRPPGPAALRRLLDQVGTIQLDAVSVLARTQYLVPFSRLGAYDPAALLRLTGPGRPWFEYWGHAASLLPVELYPLFRWRMEKEGRKEWQEWAAQNHRYIEAVRAEVADRGPLPAGQLTDPRPRQGEWWGRRSDGRLALEYLFSSGTLAAWRTANFERVYDLAERVIPADAYGAPPPATDEAQRELLARAARHVGVGTAQDLADYFALTITEARPRLAELVEDGRLVTVAVEGWKQPGYMLPDTCPRRPRRVHGTLLSPFDSLIWRRPRTEQIFGFRYRIEIYVPAAKRTYGYYVLPLLLGEELVARFDLKTERQGGRLLVGGSYVESVTRATEVAAVAAHELNALASWLGLSAIAVAARGNLASHLRSAVARQAPVIALAAAASAPKRRDTTPASAAAY